MRSVTLGAIQPFSLAGVTRTTSLTRLSLRGTVASLALTLCAVLMAQAPTAKAIGPKPDDPKSTKDAKAIGPKPDDPKTGKGTKAIGPKPDDPKSTKDAKAIGPKPDDPKTGKDTKAIGPKPDDPKTGKAPKAGATTKG